MYTVARSRLAALPLLTLLAACAGDGTLPDADRYCASRVVLVDANFEGGNFAACSVDRDNNVSMRIQPEDAPPINQSPWYSFRVSSRTNTPIRFTIRFEDGYARYWPKTSTDGKHWARLPEDAVEVIDDGAALAFSLDIGNTPMHVSGQELLTTGFYYDWIQALDARDDTSVDLIGNSVQGRPLFVARTGLHRESIILIGRQHPPEISGALAMRPFVETVLGSSELAKRFRERFAIVIIPLINPDGVALGHWRHNVNGVDLNRDWGIFSQPETRAAATVLRSLSDEGTSLRLMLDFHSTRVNTFYTQLPEESKYAFDFATVWLDRTAARIPDFDFKHDARARSGQANTKNYFYDTYGIPAITYELGDETDRASIRKTSPVFAEEMMRTLLEVDPDVVLSGRE